VTNGGVFGFPSKSGAVPDGAVSLAKLSAPQVYGYLATGNYYYATGSFNVTTSATHGVGTLRLQPWFVPNACTLAKIGAEVTSAGDSGSLVRLGIYADDGTGFPGQLVLDAGTIAGDSATVQEISISLSIRPGMYWIGGAVQSVSVTQPTLRVTNGPTALLNAWAGTSTPSSGGSIGGVSKTSVTGALPSVYTSPSVAGSVVRTFVKIA
jgi:hypothetical protein